MWKNMRTVDTLFCCKWTGEWTPYGFYRKIILLIPLIYILPHFFENKVMAVFLAEPVADVIAVTTTLILFVWQFKKALQELRE